MALGRYKIDHFFIPTERVIDTIIVRFDEYKLFVLLHCGPESGINYSKQGSNCQVLIYPTKVNFGYENPYIFSQ